MTTEPFRGRTEQGACPTEAEMAYEELIAQLQREKAALYAALEACAQEAEGWNTLSVNVAAIRIERIARDALAAARGDA